MSPPEPLAPPTTRPVRQIVRVAALIAGLLLAGSTVWLQARLWQLPTDLRALWWLLGVGVAFAVLTDRVFGPRSISAQQVPAVASDRSPADAKSTSGLAPSESRPGGLHLVYWHVIVVLAAAAFSFVLFARGTAWQIDLAWTLYVVAGATFLAGLWRIDGRRARTAFPGWSRADTVAIGVLVLLALLVRVWNVRTVPEGLWFDEGQRGLEALRMLADPTYRPLYGATALQEPNGPWYLMAPLLALLGRDPQALRLPAVVAGAAGIGAIYLLARCLYGWRVAVIAAGLAVGMTWHLNFSRIALPAIPSLTFDTLAAALLLVGLRNGNRFVLGTAGVVAALGLHFYFSSQMMVLVLAALVGHRFLAQRGMFLRRNAVGLACFIVGYVLAAGPIVSIALTEPARLTARASTVSVFNEVERAGSWQPLRDNVRAHLLMFNVQGDPNGRHNWSGRPMLDPVIGGLAVAGLALALLRPWRIERAVPLVWLPVAMMGGILSLSFEAPQSHRAIDAVVPVLLLAALPVGLLWGEIDRLLAPGREAPPPAPPHCGGEGGKLSTCRQSPLSTAVGRGWGWGFSTTLIILLLLATNVANVTRYFWQQQADTRTWNEMGGPQSAAARQIAELPQTTPIYLEPGWLGYPSVQFLDGGGRQYQPFDPSAHLPVTDESAAIFIANRPPVAEQLATLYPTAQQTVFQQPDGRAPGGYGFVLAPEVLAANRGVAARYANATGVVERRESSLDLDWSAGPPLPPPFDANLTTTLTVPAFETYQLTLDGPPSLTLTVDGVEILAGGTTGVLPLARGNHAIRVSGTGLGAEPIRLRWGRASSPPAPIEARFLNLPPVQTTGLLARLFAGEEVTGPPRVQRVDPDVQIQVHLLPLPRPYTIEWSGAIRVERPGFYRFSVGDVGAFALWIDDVLVGESAPTGTIGGDLDLEAGWHDIRIRFVDRSNFASVTAFWQPPGSPREAIPTRVLRPWPAARVAAARPEDGDLAAVGSATGEAASSDSGPRATLIAARARPTRGAPWAEGRVVPGGDAMGRPRGIAVGPDGVAYLAESTRQAIVKLAANGDTTDLGSGTLKEPSAVAVLPSGSLVVLDAGAGAAFLLEPDGTVGARLFPDLSFYGPRGISATADGRLIVADTGNGRLVIGAPGGPVALVPDLAQPTSAVLLQDGTLLVAETGAEQIVQLGPDGARLASWSMPPAATVPAPQALALPDGGWVVSVPEAQAVIIRRGPDGPVEIRPLGPAARRPSGLLLDATGQLLVADGETGALRAFALP